MSAGAGKIVNYIGKAAAAFHEELIAGRGRWRRVASVECDSACWNRIGDVEIDRQRVVAISTKEHQRS